MYQPLLMYILNPDDQGIVGYRITGLQNLYYVTVQRLDGFDSNGNLSSIGY